MAKLLARVAAGTGQENGYIELRVPRGLSPHEFRQKIIENSWPRQWLETTDGDLLNLNHILFLSIFKR